MAFRKRVGIQPKRRGGDYRPGETIRWSQWHCPGENQWIVGDVISVHRAGVYSVMTDYGRRTIDLDLYPSHERANNSEPQESERGPGFTSSIENGRYKPKSTTWLKEALETLGCDRELSRMLSLLAKDQQRIVFEVEQMTDLERQVVLSLQFQIAGGIDQKRLEQIAKVVGKGVAMT